MTTTLNAATDVFNRPAARFNGDRLDVRASALGRCRRALWYAATGQPITNPTTPESQIVLEAGNALEPVVVRAMQRSFWTVTPADPQAPLRVAVEAVPGLTANRHPDATVAIELFGDESVIEVKTRGPEAFKRWQTLGAERSHPDSVAQAACYSLGLFGEVRDVVIATLDTGSRRWNYKVIPEGRVERAWERACRRLDALADHYEARGPDPDALPERDFAAADWQCRRCPYLNTCQPGTAGADEADESEVETPNPVSDDDAQVALHEYERVQQHLKSLDEDKRGALKTLQHWLQRKGEPKARLEGREKTCIVGMVTSRRYAVDHKLLNALLEPERRAEIVTEQTSEYLRVS